MLAPFRVIKNAPYDLWWWAKDNTGAVSVGATGPAATRSLDGAAFAASSGTPAETPAASGLWKLTLTATEMAADRIDIKPTYTGPRSPEPLTLVPEPGIDSGVAQSGSTTSITLRSGAPATTLVGFLVEIVRGTGAGQAPRLITAYDTGTKVATPRPDFTTAPDNTSVYLVTPITNANIDRIDNSEYAAQAMSELYAIGYMRGTFIVGSSTSILKTSFTGKGASQIVDQALFYIGGANPGIFRRITAYDSTTGDITVSPPFANAAVSGEKFVVLGTTG